MEPFPHVIEIPPEMGARLSGLLVFPFKRDVGYYRLPFLELMNFLYTLPNPPHSEAKDYSLPVICLAPNTLRVESVCGLLLGWRALPLDGKLRTGNPGLFPIGPIIPPAGISQHLQQTVFFFPFTQKRRFMLRMLLQFSFRL